MASISKFTTAFATIPNELTVAAANFNLDFSLMKVEAPAAYQGLGQTLSAQRRAEAEEGQAHVTARKLGALFEALVPSTPHLLAKYGERVSAISRRATADMQQHPNAGIFARRTGPDGTSIWAAATSGDGALAIHLLACMLARIWKSHEAISLWVELVERRKQQIADEFKATNMASTVAVMAAKQSFTRQQLATWDASARSWLQTADADRRVQQTQLMLIINNVRIPVNSKNDTYESVIKAWTSGMMAMECLAQGMPQRVRDGAILLAMSAWHLYPDMEVLIGDPKHVDQHDELMSGALITIGAHGISSNEEGVFWSLPLARMHYYAQPELTERRLASDTSRVTINELWLVVLGIVLSQWKQVCPKPELGCKLIIRLSKVVSNESKPVAWLQYLADAASEYVIPRDVDRGQTAKLVGLGFRRCKTFLAERKSEMAPFFGLADFPLLFGMIYDEEEKIRILREIAAARGLFDDSDFLIRYHKRGKDFFNNGAFQRDQGRKTTMFYPSDKHFLRTRRFASVAPLPLKTSTPSKVSSTLHRWAPINIREEVVKCAGNACGCVYPDRPPCACATSPTGCGLICHNDLPSMSNCTTRSPILLLDRDCEGIPACDGQCSAACEFTAMEKTGEGFSTIRTGDLMMDEPFTFVLGDAEGKTEAAYDFVLGDVDDVALFSRRQVSPQFRWSPPFRRRCVGHPDMNELEKVLASDKVIGEKLGSYLRHWWRAEPGNSPDEQRQSMDALVYATSIYRSLKGATINIEVLRKPFSQSFWARFVGDMPRPPRERVFISWDEREWSSATATRPQDVYTMDHGLTMRMAKDKRVPVTPETGTRMPRRRKHSEALDHAPIAESSPALPVPPYSSYHGNSPRRPPPHFQPNFDWRIALRSKQDDDSEASWDEDEDRGFPRHGPIFLGEKEKQAHLLGSQSDQLSVSFACIAMMETGNLDIQPTSLRGVLALSTGDSIFVASSLITDPADVEKRNSIQRVFGNLGRSEVTLLIPPSQPRLRDGDPSDLKSWHLIEHAPFDGTFTDSFGSTSLHLSFTDFEMPVDVGSRGLRDTLALLVESVVSVDDAGKHIGDLDTFSVFNNLLIKVVICEHQTPGPSSKPQNEQLDGLGALTSVDCWDEFFDPPEGTAILRACGNWQARLALAAASLQLNRTTLLLPERPCLDCLSAYCTADNIKGRFDVVII